jgi:hypothetical protein
MTLRNAAKCESVGLSGLHCEEEIGLGQWWLSYFAFRLREGTADLVHVLSLVV